MNKALTALYENFCTPPQAADIRGEIKTIHKQLILKLDKPERQLVLRLIDAKDRLAEETSMDSFVYHIEPNIGRIRLKQLTPMQIQQFYNRTKQSGRVKRWEGMEDLSLSNRVVRGIHMVLRQALQQAVDLLVEDRKNHPDSPYLFPSPRTGGMWSPDAIGRTHKALLRAAGIDNGVRFHDLRHTFVTTALLNGVDVKTVSSMLGHYSAGFTLDTYTHVTAQMQRAAADKMGGFMENALPDESAPEPGPPKGKIIPFERVG